MSVSLCLDVFSVWGKHVKAGVWFCRALIQIQACPISFYSPSAPIPLPYLQIVSCLCVILLHGINRAENTFLNMLLAWQQEGEEEEEEGNVGVLLEELEVGFYLSPIKTSSTLPVAIPVRWPAPLYASAPCSWLLYRLTHPLFPSLSSSLLTFSLEHWIEHFLLLPFLSSLIIPLPFVAGFFFFFFQLLYPHLSPCFTIQSSFFFPLVTNSLLLSRIHAFFPHCQCFKAGKWCFWWKGWKYIMI